MTPAVKEGSEDSSFRGEGPWLAAPSGHLPDNFYEVIFLLGATMSQLAYSHLDGRMGRDREPAVIQSSILSEGKKAHRHMYPPDT
jgi:hypothetical protein